MAALLRTRPLGFALAALAGLAGCDDGDTTEDPPVDGPGVTCEGDVCRVGGGVYTEDLEFTADKTWFLDGKVFIGDGTTTNTLTIQPGTTVLGRASESVPGALIIQQNARIMAEGTADAMIVLTSDQGDMSRSGNWGGLVINGNAPINGCDAAPCTATGEGDTGTYGGDDPADSSGTIRYLRVEYAGTKLTADSEFNGIAFQGVGSGTTVEYIQVHANADDGIEFFGGTVNAKYVVLTGVEDDSLDWTDGWTGKVQFLIARQLGDQGDQGIEADNNGDNNDLEPRSNPTLANMTFIGHGSSDLGILLREGTRVSLHDTVVTGFGEACFAMDQVSTFEQACTDATTLTGQFTVEGVVIGGCGADFAEPVDDADNPLAVPCSVEQFFTLEPDVRGNQVRADLSLDGYRLPAGSDLLTAGATPNDPFFTSVPFIGAVGEDDWTAGWAVHLD